MDTSRIAKSFTQDLCRYPLDHLAVAITSKEITQISREDWSFSDWKCGKKLDVGDELSKCIFDN